MHSLWQRKQPYHAYQLRRILPILCELFLIGPNPHSPVMLRFNLTFLLCSSFLDIYICHGNYAFCIHVYAHLYAEAVSMCGVV